MDIFDSINKLIESPKSIMHQTIVVFASVCTILSLVVA